MKVSDRMWRSLTRCIASQLCVFAVNKGTGELTRIDTKSIDVNGPVCVGFVPVENGEGAESETQPAAEKAKTRSQL